VLPEAPGAAANPLPPEKLGLLRQLRRSRVPGEASFERALRRLGVDRARDHQDRERARPPPAQSKPFRAASSSWTRLRSVRTSARSAEFLVDQRSDSLQLMVAVMDVDLQRSDERPIGPRGHVDSTYELDSILSAEDTALCDMAKRGVAQDGLAVRRRVPVRQGPPVRLDRVTVR
jgi:hypothetical protein